MSEAQKDRERSLAACKVLIDGRDPVAEMASIMVTLEHAVTMMLLVTQGGDPARAVGMLNEGLVEGIEGRIALFASRAVRQ
jgi:hypothetical protein